jgi:hypothetical protein
MNLFLLKSENTKYEGEKWLKNITDRGTPGHGDSNPKLLLSSGRQ